GGPEELRLDLESFRAFGAGGSSGGGDVRRKCWSAHSRSVRARSRTDRLPSHDHGSGWREKVRGGGGIFLWPPRSRRSRTRSRADCDSTRGAAFRRWAGLMRALPLPGVASSAVMSLCLAGTTDAALLARLQAISLNLAGRAAAYDANAQAE